MSQATADRFVDYEDPGKWSSWFLALLMHGLLVAALVVSVRWQTRHEPVMAELWVPAPTIQAPAPEPTPPSPPAPQIKSPAPVREAAPPPKVDIALKDTKKKIPEKLAPKPVDKAPSFDELLSREEAQIERRKQERENVVRSEQEAALLKQLRTDQETRARNTATEKARADYIGRLQGKIRGNLVQPPNLKGNPTARLKVSQLPNGEVLEIRVLKPSGNPLYDDAIERAIRKSSPLPLPDDRSLFDRDLIITYCPAPDASGRCPQ